MQCFPTYCPWPPPIILHHYLTSSAPHLHPCPTSDPLTIAIGPPHIRWPMPQARTSPTHNQLCYAGCTRHLASPVRVPQCSSLCPCLPCHTPWASMPWVLQWLLSQPHLQARCCQFPWPSLVWCLQPGSAPHSSCISTPTDSTVSMSVFTAMLARPYSSCTDTNC